ncbi:heavy metal translocating P-type ATPase [Citricoccus sp. GCM10030269]|uniref:heavy metal translocating P-type ATPase n=1 Tax=Citricoccus sp. GCM10030269 TaxID=3273388 RepID=UPI00361F064E
MSGECCTDKTPVPTSARASPREHTWSPEDASLWLAILSGVALAVGFGLNWSGAEIPGLLLQWLALAAGALTFVPGALRGLLRGRLGVGLLMTISAVGAVLLGHVGEAAALAFLFSLAEALEDRAMDRAKGGLRALLSLMPETARIARDQGVATIPAAEVREQNVLLVGAGDRAATDGVVLQGHSSLDLSAVTGESIPVAVTPGDPVPAGAINGSGTLRIEATASARDNSLTQIVSLVEQAHARKGVRARLADRMTKPLIPAVLVIAAVIALFGLLTGDPATWIERALVVLVAASPCALAIAVPVTVISAIGSASTYGVVITSGQAFEQLGTIRTVAFDKTGTLTRNEPRVVEVRTAPGHDQAELLRNAAALESSSSHPLAAAIIAAAPGIAPAQEVTEEPGFGLRGRVGAAHLRLGTPRWLYPGPLRAEAEEMAARGMTVVVVEIDGGTAGVIGIRDELRPEAAETIRLFSARGIRTVMVTGDHSTTARALAAEAGIQDVRWEQLPADKAAVIEELVAEAPTAMVGDGVNDAPALAAATVGIAMGSSGSRAAVESADVAFTGHDLRLIPGVLAHVRRGRRIMTWNIGVALAIIVVLFPLALFGILGLAGVVLVHEIAEVLVIVNGVRAARRPRGTV